MEPHEQPTPVPQTPIIIPRQEAAGEPIFPAEQPPRRARPPRRLIATSKRLAIVLFLMTFASTFLVGMTPGAGPVVAVVAVNAVTRYIETGKKFEFAEDEQKVKEEIVKLLTDGITFSCALLLILFAHEMGHYLQARRYRVPATLPLFIPFPLSPLGTLGAVILQGAGVANRKSLFDIAISGPLAGLVVALPITYYGLATSQILAIQPGYVADISYQDPLLIKWMIALIHRPLEANEDVQLNALLFAGWAGILVTALNLVPIGQLDGGHILYTLLGKRAHTVAMLLLGASIVYMAVTGNYTYSLIVILLVVFGPRHPPTADDTVPLGWFRVLLGWLTLCFIFIGFTPDPLNVTSRREPAEAPRKQQKQEKEEQLPVLKKPHYVDAGDSPHGVSGV